MVKKAVEEWNGFGRLIGEQLDRYIADARTVNHKCGDQTLVITIDFPLHNPDFDYIFLD